MSTSKSRIEAFCQAYLTEPNAAEAARRAGYSAAYANRQGWRLLRRPAVIARLAELQAELAERECLGRDAQLAKLEAAYRVAMAKAQPAAAARIVDAQTRLVERFAAPATSLADAGLAADCAALRAAIVEMAKVAGLPAPRFAAPADDTRATPGRRAVDAR